MSWRDQREGRVGKGGELTACKKDGGSSNLVLVTCVAYVLCSSYFEVEGVEEPGVSASERGSEE